MKARQVLGPVLAVTALLSALAHSVGAAPQAGDTQWVPAGARLMTSWGRKVDPEHVLPEYPRPQLVRDGRWTNLNGLWQRAVRPRGGDIPDTWDGSILVPFCIESALSGVGQAVTPDQVLWYRRTFRSNAGDGERTLLHFGAVDWECTVWVDGWQVGTHRGGYAPFTFDVTDALDPSRSEHELTVRVWDPTDTGEEPRGKQVLHPQGIWYTAVTGIWQTVWLERVPALHVERVHVVTDPAAGSVSIRVETTGPGEVELVARPEKGAAGETAGSVRGSAGTELDLPLSDAHPWTPDDPWLYSLQVTLRAPGGTDVVDRVTSYFALRSIAVGPDADGVQRLLLNGKPLFQYGPLDQGWWPDGLYTAPSDEALRHDLEVTKAYGFNMVRKHVKVEPARWYRHCDELGLLVWQDIPSGFVQGGGKGQEAQPVWTATEGVHTREAAEIVDALEPFPCVVVWVPFNEGWGQKDTERTVAWLERRDPTRLVDDASGWTDRGVGAMHDVHVYPGPGMPATEPDRAVVLGEFGGLGLPVAEHTWIAQGNWGYRTFDNASDLTDAYLDLLERLHVLIGRGLSAAVYTQTTDVEVEVNGLMTYDRAVQKIDVERARAAALRLQEPPPRLVPVLPSAQDGSQTWRYRLDDPGDGWQAAGFDDSAWSEGAGGFGSEGTPGAHIGTPWTSSDVWLRRTFDLSAVPRDLYLWMHHDEDAEVYLDGVKAASLRGYSVDYGLVPIAKEAQAALHPGKNVLAIHCHQTSGGQYVDAGLVRVEEGH